MNTYLITVVYNKVASRLLLRADNGAQARIKVLAWVLADEVYVELKLRGTITRKY